MEEIGAAHLRLARMGKKRGSERRRRWLKLLGVVSS